MLYLGLRVLCKPYLAITAMPTHKSRRHFRAAKIGKADFLGESLEGRGEFVKFLLSTSPHGTK